MQIPISPENYPIFNSLASPTRLQILNLLAEGPSNIHSLAQAVGITPTMAVKHIRQLEAAGIMTLSGEETLTCLAEKIGPERAMTAAHLLAKALDNVENLCGSFQNGCGFRRMDSLRYATESEGSAVLRREYSLRLHNGMDVELLDADTASEQFTFPMSAGVYTKNTAAQVDPYRLQKRGYPPRSRG